MGDARVIVKNTMVLLSAKAVNSIMGFFYMMYTARYLGVEGFGVLSFGLAFTGIFAIVSDIGLNTLFTREAARDKSLTKKYLGNIAGIKIILVIIMVGIIALVANMMSYPPQTIRVIYLLTLFIIFSAFTGLFNSVFQVYEQMEYQSIGEVLNSVIMLAGILYAIKNGFDTLGFAKIYVIASFIVLLYSITICIWKFVLPKIEIDLNVWKLVFKEALPFGLTASFGIIYTYADSVILYSLQGDTVVGWYNAAYRLIQYLIFVPIVINIAVFPAMSRFYVSSESSLKLIYEKYSKLMIVIAIPMGLGTTVLAGDIIHLIYRNDYDQSIIALQLLIWTSVLTFAGAAFVRLLESTNKQRVITKLSAICMVVNIALNLMLIPVYSYIGASIAILVTQFILFVGVLILSYKFGYGIEVEKVKKELSKVLIASIAMVAFILIFINQNVLFLIASSAVIYLIVYYVLGGFDDDDINLLKQIINFKPDKQ